jgi:hypothetical protein
VFGCALEPIHCFVAVGWSSDTVTQHPAKRQLRFDPALLGCLKKPFQRRDPIARRQLSGEVDSSKYFPGNGIARA